MKSLHYCNCLQFPLIHQVSRATLPGCEAQRHRLPQRPDCSTSGWDANANNIGYVLVDRANAEASRAILEAQHNGGPTYLRLYMSKGKILKRQKKRNRQSLCFHDNDNDYTFPVRRPGVHLDNLEITR
jgi:hypothetical protein